MESIILVAIGFLIGVTVSYLVERKRFWGIMNELEHLQRTSEEMQAGYKVMRKEISNLMARYNSTLLKEMKEKYN